MTCHNTHILAQSNYHNLETCTCALEHAFQRYPVTTSFRLKEKLIISDLLDSLELSHLSTANPIMTDATAANILLSLNSGFDQDQTNHFWRKIMGLSERTQEAFAVEGLLEVSDLHDFTKDDLKALFTNMRKPPKARIMRGSGENATSELVETEPFHVSAKSQKRIIIAADAVRVFRAIGRPITPDIMTWDVLSSFELQWTAIQERKDKAEEDVPKLQKNMSIVKWIDSFRLHCRATYGVRDCCMSYLLRPYAEVDVSQLPPLKPGMPFSEDHGDLEEEMIAYLSHDHSLYGIDNRQLLKMIETGLRGTSYASTVVRFRQAGDGRGCFLALESTHAGKSVWEKRIKDAEAILSGREWTGTGNITLEAHLDKHRTAFIAITEASSHVRYQVPDGRTRVTKLLDSIKSGDAQVAAALAAIRQDDAGMREDFEAAATYLLPSCPVAARKGSRDSRNADISAASAINPKLESGKGKTGVELRWYAREEFRKLSKAQKEELRQWTATQPPRNGGSNNRNTRGGGGGGGGGSGQVQKKKIKRMIASLIRQQTTSDSKKQRREDELTDGLLSLVSSVSRGTAQQSPKKGSIAATQGASNPQAEEFSPEQRAHAAVVAGTLQSILRRSKGGKRGQKRGRGGGGGGDSDDDE